MGKIEVVEATGADDENPFEHMRKQLESVVRRGAKTILMFSFFDGDIPEFAAEGIEPERIDQMLGFLQRTSTRMQNDMNRFEDMVVDGDDEDDQ